jgi:hypothetical protein
VDLSKARSQERAWRLHHAVLVTFVFALIALLHLAAAVYAQQGLPRYVAGARRTALLRALLIVAGLGVGSLATIYAAQPAVAVLAFLSGFGAVHVPAALILFFKRQSGAGRS